MVPAHNNDKILGVIPPMITPFTPDGRIYEKGLDNVLEFLIGHGVHGLFCIGSYGSFALMEAAERKQLAEMILHRVGGRIPVILQVGSPATHIAADLARHGEGAGASAVAAVLPFYYSGFAYKDADLVEHYAAICDAVDIPVYIYNNPKTTGFHASVDLLKQLASVGVRGMKDSSGDYMYLVETVRELRELYPNFNVMAGTAGLYQPLYYQGSCGCVAGTANAFPEVLVSLHDALENGDLQKASELQSLVIALRKVQAIRGFRPASCYTMLSLRGIDCGTVRSPWRQPDDSQREQMRVALEELGILSAAEVGASR